MKKSLILLSFLVCFWGDLVAQAPHISVKDSVLSGVLIDVQVAGFVPAADFGYRYGLSGGIGLGIHGKNKRNWQIGGDVMFHFSNIVQGDTVLKGITTDDGEIIDPNGDLQKVLYQLRGFSVFGSADKIWPTSNSNPNSGWLTGLGLGFFQHQLRFSLANKTVPPQLEKQYTKGYDRLTNGIAISQRLGYQYLSNNRLVNFTISAYIIEAFTKNRRTINFDTGTSDDDLKFDFLYGVRIGWVLPLYNSGKVHEF